MTRSRRETADDQAESKLRPLEPVVPSMFFARELSVSSDAKTCWEVLTDVPQVVAWVSIVDDAREISPLEKYTAVLMDRLGPFKLRAELDIIVGEVEVGNRIRVRASGEDRQVSSRVGIDAVLRLTDLDSGPRGLPSRGTTR